MHLNVQPHLPRITMYIQLKPYLYSILIEGSRKKNETPFLGIQAKPISIFLSIFCFSRIAEIYPFHTTILFSKSIDQIEVELHNQRLYLQIRRNYMQSDLRVRMRLPWKLPLARAMA